MLTVTDAAGEHLVRMLTVASEGTAIRLVASGKDLKVQLDSAKPGDATFDHKGARVLVLDEQAAGLLAGKTLDVTETNEGPRLALV